MRIKNITIEGVEGDLEIRQTSSGALIIANDVELEIERTASFEARFNMAYNAAKVVYGTDRRGNPNATNSMVHEVLAEIERITGC